MPVIPVFVRGRFAAPRGMPQIVCGNSGDTVRFLFDAEWDALPLKTMRVIRYSGGLPLYTDILFEGDTAPLPAVYDTPEITVGVYAGDIRTTTPIRIPCVCCIADSAPLHPDPQPDVYAQLLDYLSKLETGEPFAYSCTETKAVSAGYVSDDLIAIAEEVS